MLFSMSHKKEKEKEKEIRGENQKWKKYRKSSKGNKDVGERQNKEAGEGQARLQLRI